MTELPRGLPVSLLATVSLAMLMPLLGASAVSGQSVTAALKAVFLYNFARFTEWPSDVLAPNQTLSLCVVGDNEVGDALEQTVRGRAMEGHELRVEIVRSDRPIPVCHLVYIAGRDANRFAPVLETLKGAPVFTVGEGDRFVESGGIAELTPENDRLRFTINGAAAVRARLQLSSKLVSLAKIMKDHTSVQR